MGVGCCSSASSAQVAIWKKKIHKHEALLNETPMGEAPELELRGTVMHAPTARSGTVPISTVARKLVTRELASLKLKHTNNML